MVTGFYASLAASASVFIGILTAILTSKVSTLRAERNQIEHRIKSIDSRLESLDEQRNELEDQIEGIRRIWEHEDQLEGAKMRVSEFIDQRVGGEFTVDPDSVTKEEVIEEFADFVDFPVKEVKTDEYITEELEARFDEIQEALRDESYPGSAKADIAADAGTVATYQQTEAQQRIHQRAEYNRFQNRWHQTKTELQSLKNERDKLENRHKSLDTSPIKSTLWAGVVTIFLSVVIPSIAYLLHILEITVVRLPSWVEPSSIFVVWVIGLGLIFYHLRGGLVEDAEDQALPEQPDIELEGLEFPGGSSA